VTVYYLLFFVISIITVLDALMWIKHSVKQITGSCVTKCFKKSGFILENLPVDLDNTDLENEIIVGEQLVNMLPNSYAR